MAKGSSASLTRPPARATARCVLSRSKKKNISGYEIEIFAVKKLQRLSKSVLFTNKNSHSTSFLTVNIAWVSSRPGRSKATSISAASSVIAAILMTTSYSEWVLSTSVTSKKDHLHSSKLLSAPKRAKKMKKKKKIVNSKKIPWRHLNKKKSLETFLIWHLKLVLMLT